MLVICHVYYWPQRSWAKVMFLQASVILSTGGVLPQCMLGCQPPRDQRPPWTRQTPTPHPPGTRDPPASGRHPPGTRAPPPDQADPDPPDQADPPGPGRHPPPGSRRQHVVNERPVRILVECILVFLMWNSADVCFGYICHFVLQF